MKTLSLLTLCAALFSFGGAAYAQVDQSEPQILIRTATQQILDEVRARAIAPDDIPRIMDIVNRDILPYTDFRRTTSLAMGRYWRTATPAQQQQLVEQFKMLLISRKLTDGLRARFGLCWPSDAAVEGSYELRSCRYMREPDEPHAPATNPVPPPH